MLLFHEQSFMNNWVLELLSVRRILPRAMFGGRQSVVDLDLFLFADQSARIASGLYRREEDEILRRFSTWLCDVRFNCPRAHGKVVIKRFDPSETSVTSFFALFDEFRHSAGIEWLPAKEIPDRWYWHIKNAVHPNWQDCEERTTNNGAIQA